MSDYRPFQPGGDPPKGTVWGDLWREFIRKPEGMFDSPLARVFLVALVWIVASAIGIVVIGVALMLTVLLGRALGVW